MKKLQVFSLFVLLLPVIAMAQSTTVTGTIVDSAGTTWANASVNVVFQPTPGVPGPYNWSGGAYNPQPPAITANSSGAFSITLPANSAIAPSGSTWVFTITPTATMPACILNLPLSSGTVDISATIHSTCIPKTVQSQPIPIAYNNSQLSTPPNPGQIYYNVTTNAINGWTGSAWNPLVGGGGGTPGGANTEGQINNAGSSFAGNGFFYPQNGVEGFSSYNSTQTSPVSSFNGQTYGNFYNCSQDAIYPFGGFGEVNCRMTNINLSAYGFNFGNENLYGNAGWSVSSDDAVHANFYTPGISQHSSINVNCLKVGDCATAYWYQFSHGGGVDFSGEGQTTLKVNGGQPESNNFWGKSTLSGTGIINMTTNTNQGQPTVGGYLYDVPNISLSGKACGNTIVVYDAPTGATINRLNMCPGTTSVPSAIATTTTSVPITSAVDPKNGQSLSFTVADVSGPALNTGSAFAACIDYGMPINITTASAPSGGNQNITATIWAGMPSGCRIYQGGTHGIIELIADSQRFDSGLNTYSWTTGLIVAGANDNASLDVFWYAVRPTKLFNWLHNFGQSSSANLTRSSNTTTWCNINYNFTAQTLQVSSASDSSYNGTFTAGALDNNGCVSWTNTGSNGTATATVSIGGVVGTLGSFNVRNAAKIKKDILTPTTVFGNSQLNWTGQIELYPNDMVVAAGDYLLNPDDPSFAGSGIAATGRYAMTPNNGGYTQGFFGGDGQGTSGNYSYLSVLNSSPFSNYLGTGGRLTGPIGLNMQGPFNIAALISQPLPNGVLFNLQGNNSIVNGNPNYEYSFLAVEGPNHNQYVTSFINPVQGYIRFDMNNAATGASSEFRVSPTGWTGFASGTFVYSNSGTGDVAQFQQSGGVVAKIASNGDTTMRSATFTGPTPTTTAGQVAIGNTVVTGNTNCGGATVGATGCIQISIGGVTHYVPYF